MDSQQNQASEESLENLFVAFADIVFPKMKDWAEAPTDEPSWKTLPDRRDGYFMLLWKNKNDPFWKREEVDRFFRAHWIEKGRHFPEILAARDIPETPPPQQLQDLLFTELLAPIPDLLKRYNVFEHEKVH